jgi:hypothetical protein
MSGVYQNDLRPGTRCYNGADDWAFGPLSLAFILFTALFVGVTSASRGR